MEAYLQVQKRIALQCHFSALDMTMHLVLFKRRDSSEISEYLKHTKSTQHVFQANYHFSPVFSTAE